MINIFKAYSIKSIESFEINIKLNKDKSLLSNYLFLNCKNKVLKQR